MSLSRQKKKKRNKKGKLTPEQIFQKEWQRVQNLQKKNNNRQAEIEELITRVVPHIEQPERILAESLYLQVEKMLVFLSRKSLPEWCKGELLDWLEINITILNHHPFTDHLDITRLNEDVAEVFEVFIPKLEPGLNEFFEQESPYNEQEESKTEAEKKTGKHRAAPIDDMFNELFEEFDTPEKNANNSNKDEDALGTDDFFEEIFEQWEQMFEAEDEHEKQKHKELDKLLRASNINKMFRKIARILHPDKELDPQKKEQRHQQMSELLAARDEKDITALFTLYDKHIGKAPLEELGEDLESATRLLKHQAQNLREQQNLFEPSTPLEAYVFEHFGKTSKRNWQQTLTRHKLNIKKTTEAQLYILSNMKSIRTLKPLLDDRYEYRMLDDMEKAYLDETVGKY